MYAKKSLGQHFLTCEWAVHTAVETANLTKKDVVLEIGPGTGVLTRILAAKAGKVIAVEKDELLAEHLKIEFKSHQTADVSILIGDILKDFSAIAKAYGFTNGNYKVAANIPYYLTSRLLRILLETGPRPSLMTLMIQEEVAQRLCAQIPDMNLLGLSVQAYGTPRIIKIVPASCFLPKPKVNSAIVAISNISDAFFTADNIDKNNFFRILRLAFSHKRKQLANTLSSLAPRKDIEAFLKESGLSPRARPQELSLDQWKKLFSILQNKL